jgi:inhibitor of KinA sporulation pathway (predicted exonuclease)
VILNAAYHVSGSAAAWWKFYNNRCYRTLKNLPAAKGTTIDRGTGTHHNALDDAVSQAKHAVQILKRMDDQAEKAWMYEGLCK